ncbi:MAG: Uma2 family endonuclease [bacterium]
MAKRASTATATAQRRRFTVDEYRRLGAIGVLRQDDRVELLDGEIIQMTPIGSPHAGCVGALTELFHRRFGRQALVWVQNPFQLGPWSEPQPDLCLLRRRADFYRTAHPAPADVLLVVEVADASLAYDRDRKLPAYAAGKIAEVWIVDLAGAAVDVHRRPLGRSYRDVTRHQRGTRLAPLAFPDRALRVNDILG